MTIKTLREKIKDLPDDAIVELGIDIKVNSQSASLTRIIDSVDHIKENNVVILRSWYGVKFFY